MAAWKKKGVQFSYNNSTDWGMLRKSRCIQIFL